MALAAKGNKKQVRMTACNDKVWFSFTSSFLALIKPPHDEVMCWMGTPASCLNSTNSSWHAVMANISLSNHWKTKLLNLITMGFSKDIHQGCYCQITLILISPRASQNSYLIGYIYFWGRYLKYSVWYQLWWYCMCCVMTALFVWHRTQDKEKKALSHSLPLLCPLSAALAGEENIAVCVAGGLPVFVIRTKWG